MQVARIHNQISRAAFKTYKRRGPKLDQGLPTSYFRVSDTYECDRRLYFKRTGAHIWNPYSPVTREKFAKGNLLHDHVRGFVIPKLTPWVVSHWQPEELLTCRYEIDGIKLEMRGHCDGILWKAKLKKPQGLLEVKSTGLFSYKKTTSLNFTDPTHWSISYPIQGNRYLHMWNELHPEEKVPAIVILVYNVNGDEDPLTNMPFRDYWFKPDHELFAQDLRRLARIERSIRDGEIPKAYYEKCEWQCKGCPYFKQCWPEKFAKAQEKAKQPRRPRASATSSVKVPRRVPAAGRPLGTGDVPE